MEHVEGASGRHELHPHIAHYTRIFGDASFAKELAPNPGAVVVFSLAGSYRIAGSRPPEAAVFGIQGGPLRLESDAARTDRVQVVFEPAGMSRFTDLAASQATGRILPAGELFGQRRVEALLDALSAASELEARILLLDRFFLELFRPPTPIERDIQGIALAICRDPTVSVASLLRGLPASLRQIERLFARLVGTSPRSFARIARFSRARGRVLRRAGSSLGEIALDAGYYDQAHFDRDFKSLAGLAPGRYTACPPLPEERPGYDPATQPDSATR